jgi:hypothetical protein
VIALVKSPLELDLRCRISGAGMVVTLNEFPMPILIAANERLIVSVEGGYVVAQRADGLPPVRKT